MSAVLEAPVPDGMLIGTCWCGAGYVLVTPEEVRTGRTHECRRKTCRPPR